MLSRVQQAYFLQSEAIRLMIEQRPSMFIGSSSEGLHLAKAIQANLDQECEITLWSQGLFGLGEGTLESLVAKLDDFDFSTLVLTPDDMVRSRKKTSPSPRDNVLLELGLFIGRLGRRRTFVVYDRTADMKLPSDLAGVTFATFHPHTSQNWQATVGAACTQIERVVRELGPRFRATEVASEPRCLVDIYYHARGLTKDHAHSIAKSLERHGIKSTLMEHDSPSPPDAAFIGSHVTAEDARIVFSLVPYDVKYLFRPDYPESEGGAASGCKIGVGYFSGYNADRRSRRCEPVRISKSQLAELLSRHMTNTEFQCLLHKLTRSYETA